MAAATGSEGCAVADDRLVERFSRVPLLMLIDGASEEGKTAALLASPELRRDAERKAVARLPSGCFPASIGDTTTARE